MSKIKTRVVESCGVCGESGVAFLAKLYGVTQRVVLCRAHTKSRRALGYELVRAS